MDNNLYNNIKSFKQRTIDLTEKVKVYRCLHKSKECTGQKVYSLQQNGLVVGHATSLLLSSTTFKVSEKGRERVIKEGQKNVHAFVIGWVSDETIVPQTRLFYNPYIDKGFVTLEGDNRVLVPGVNKVLLNQDGVFGEI